MKTTRTRTKVNIIYQSNHIIKTKFKKKTNRNKTKQNETKQNKTILYNKVCGVTNKQ